MNSKHPEPQNLALSLKEGIRRSSDSSILSAEMRQRLHQSILQTSLSAHSLQSKQVLSKWSTVWRAVHQSGGGYLAAALVAGVLVSSWNSSNTNSSAPLQAGLLDASSKNASSTMGEPLVSERPTGEGEMSIQSNKKLAGILPADFDLEGDYEALPTVVKEVLGEKLGRNTPLYQVRMPEQVRTQFQPGEGRFFAANDGKLGVSLELKPRPRPKTLEESKKKTLIVLPSDLSASEMAKLTGQRPAELLKNVVRWDGRVSGEKSLEELVREAEDEIHSSMEVRSQRASWNSGNMRYVLFNE